MLVQLLDAQTVPHFVTWQGLDQINDYSSTLGAGAVGGSAAPQQCIPQNTTAAGSAGCRCGVLIQNTSVHSMLILELAGAEVASAFVLEPYAFFPPSCSYPITTNEIVIQGGPDSIEGDAYAAREFVNAPNE